MSDETHLPDGRFDLGPYLDELTPERSLLGIQRACKKLGIEHGYNEDGQFFCDADTEDPTFLDACGEEWSKMLVGNAMANLREQGIIEYAEVTDDGEADHVLTEEGWRTLNDQA